MKNLEAVGLILWWAEGSKSRRDKRWKNAVSYPIELTNTDPRIINIFILFLTDIMRVDKERIKLQLQIHEGDDKQKLETYWSDIAGINVKNFQKTIIRPIGIKVGKTKGTCKVRFSDKVLYNRLEQKFQNLIKDFPGCGAVG